MSDTYTDFQAPTGMDQNSLSQNGYGMVQYGPGDDRKIVIFYNKAVRNPARSADEGRPIHEDRVFVKIQEPGEKLNVIDRPVKDDDKRRWPNQWRQFSMNQKQIPDGTPVDLLFPQSPAIAGSLQAYGIHTIEQLARLSAEGISTVGMGATEWVNKAKSYMEKAEKGVAFHQMQTALNQRDSQIAVLNNQVGLLKAQLDQVLAQSKPAAVTQYHPPVDEQTVLINARAPENFELPPTAFNNSVDAPKAKGWPKGKPRGPRQPKESES